MFRFRLLNGRKNNQISVLTLRFFDSPVAHKDNRTTETSNAGKTKLTLDSLTAPSNRLFHGYGNTQPKQ